MIYGPSDSVTIDILK